MQEFTERELLFENDKEVLDKLPQILHSGMIFVDVGANLGRYTFEVNKNLNRGSIYVIESDPIKFSKLKDNCAKWEALSNNSIYALKINLSNGQEKEKTSLNSFKLDTLFERIDPDIIKINGTGNELEILQGSTRLLKRGKARFLLVMNKKETPEVQDSSADICSFMNSFGYYPQKIDGKNLFTNPKKHLFHRFKKIYRQIVPEAFRRWLKSRF